MEQAVSFIAVMKKRMSVCSQLSADYDKHAGNYT